MSKILNIDTKLLEEAPFFTFVSEDNSTLQAQSSDLALAIKNPYAMDLTRFLPNIETFDLNRFYSLTQTLVIDACKRLEQPEILLVEDYPPIDFPSESEDVITYKLIHREPAKLGEDGKRFQQHSFKYHTYLKREDCILVRSRPLDDIIEFKVWARNNKRANKTVEFFEDLMVNHEWIFTSNGAERFRYLERLSDEYQVHQGNALFARPTRFFIRYSKFLTLSVPALKELRVTLKINSE